MILLVNQKALQQLRTQGTFRTESTLVDRGHVVSLYCPDFGQYTRSNLLLYFPNVPGRKLTPFNYSINMLVYYIASLKINCFIAQNLGNKAKPCDQDPLGYFRCQKYPGYEGGSAAEQIINLTSFIMLCAYTFKSTSSKLNSN